jgi:phosphoribosylformimino-5-aminoimidazole carboxamide ribonucleotide (ProFAR) isomerase
MKSSGFRMVRRFKWRFDSFYSTIKTKEFNTICTDIAKDGMLEGPSFDLYAKNFGRSKGIKAIAKNFYFWWITKAELVCEGTIIGKAIYEGRISLSWTIYN